MCGEVVFQRGFFAILSGASRLPSQFRPSPPPAAAVAVPCFCFGRRYALAKDRPLPLLRFGCFCRRQRLSCAVPHAWEAPLSGASRQLSPGESKCTPVDRDKLCGKANKNGFFCCNNTTKRAVFMPSQSRSARQLPRTRGSQNVTFRLGLPRLRDCAAEALPAAETAEAEQGQRSAFCEGAATPEAKAGHRNPGGRYKQCGGQPYSRPPQRDPIFRDAKVLLFWCDQQQKE